jgi:hypothetical protein
MTKIRFGNQHDQSRAQYRIDSEAGATSEIEFGDQFDRSIRTVVLHDRSVLTDRELSAKRPGESVTRSMRLADLHAALMHAFPTVAALERVVQFELDQNLQSITSGRSLQEVAFELIRWADATGRMSALVEGALKQNPTSPALKQLVKGESGSVST